MRTDEALFGGSAGPGKSAALRADIIQCGLLIQEHERWRLKHIQQSRAVVANFRRTMPMHEESFARSKELYIAADPGFKVVDQKSRYVGTFSCGMKVIWGHLKDDDAFMDHRSQEYCVGRGTRVRMADGGLVSIEDVRPGDLVATLEGPRRVVATAGPRVKPCVSVSVYRGREACGSQVQPVDHPLLTIVGGTSKSSSGELRTATPPRTASTSWLSHESLLCVDLESPEAGAFGSDAEIDGAASCGSPRGSRLRLTSSFLAVHAELPLLRSATGSPAPIQSRCEQSSREFSPDPRQAPELRRESSPSCRPRTQPPLTGSSRRLPSHGAAGETAGPGTTGDSPGDCRRDPGSHGAPLPGLTGSGPASPPSPAEPASRVRCDRTPDAPGSAQADTRVEIGEYVHPYDGTKRTVSQEALLSRASCVGSFVGEREVFDIQVEEVNHYITECGLVNRNCRLSFDEARDFTREQYAQMQTRIRTSDPHLEPFLASRAGSNPDPGWLREHFVDPAPEGRRVLKRTVTLDDGTEASRTRIFIPALLRDHPSAAFRRQYEAQLRTQPRHIQAALLNGDWYVIAGAFFAEVWDPALVVIKPFKIPRHWARFRSMDWGLKSECVVLWWAVTPDGELIVYRERTFNGKSAKGNYLDAHGVALKIKDIEEANDEWNLQKDRSRLTGPADTQLWSDIGQKGGRTMAMDFADVGVNWIKASKGRTQNAQQVYKRLGERPRPGLMFFDTCHGCITTIPALGTDESNGDAPKEGGPDHWYDACFEGQTEVVTDCGPVAIVDLVGRPGRVLSTDGEFHRHSGAFLTRKGADVVRVSFVDGTSVVCTPDHRFLTSTGEWKAASRLDAMCYAFEAWNPSLSAEPFRNSTAAGTISAGSTSRTQGSDCTSQCGSTTTAGARQATTSTTSTKTEATTRFEISHACQARDTEASTASRSGSTPRHSEGTSSARRTPPGHGTPLPPDSNCTESLDAARPPQSSQPPSDATSVARDSSIRASGSSEGSARPSVDPSGDEIRSSTTRSAFALPAGKTSWQDGSRLSGHALGTAVGVLRVEPAGSADVYCLTVPGMGAFAVAGGLIVSNCQYGCAQRVTASEALPANKNRRDEDEDDDEAPAVSWGRYGYGGR